VWSVEGVIEELVPSPGSADLLRPPWRHSCCCGWMEWLGQDLALDAQATRAKAGPKEAATPPRPRGPAAPRPGAC
jgi:hypothetical protein